MQMAVGRKTFDMRKRINNGRKPVEGSLFGDDDFEPIMPAIDLSKYNFDEVFGRLAKSDFRRRFRLNDEMKYYVTEKGLGRIGMHAADIIRKRLAPAAIPNDGKQTPMKGHPVFVAQHATGCCCRDCLSKWHGIEAGRELTAAEQEYVVALLLTWISRQL